MGTLGTGERSSNAMQGGQDAGVCLCMKGLCQLCEVTWPTLPALRPEPKAERPHSKHTHNFFPMSRVKAEEQTLVAFRAPGSLLLHCRKPLASLAEGRARPGWARDGGSLPHINGHSWAPVDPWGPQRASEGGEVPSLFYRGDNFSGGASTWRVN